jgi:hypothetical protein
MQRLKFAKNDSGKDIFLFRESNKRTPEMGPFTSVYRLDCNNWGLTRDDSNKILALHLYDKIHKVGDKIQKNMVIDQIEVHDETVYLTISELC